MARAPDARGGASRLVSVKAVSDGYPLRGALRVGAGPGTPPADTQSAPAPGTAWVDTAVLEALGLGPAHVAGLSWGGTVVLELYRHHPEHVATLILVDSYAGWKGSLPEAEVRARVAGMREALAAPAAEFDPTLPGLFAAGPPPEFAGLMEEMAAAVRPGSVRTQLSVMAGADQRDLLPRIAAPTLLIWGEADVRSPLGVARQFEEAIPDTTLVVLPGAGHLTNLERPGAFNDAVRAFCRAHPPS